MANLKVNSILVLAANAPKTGKTNYNLQLSDGSIGLVNPAIYEKVQKEEVDEVTFGEPSELETSDGTLKFRRVVDITHSAIGKANKAKAKIAAANGLDLDAYNKAMEVLNQL